MLHFVDDPADVIVALTRIVTDCPGSTVPFHVSGDVLTRVTKHGVDGNTQTGVAPPDSVIVGSTTDSTIEIVRFFVRNTFTYVTL